MPEIKTASAEYTVLEDNLFICKMLENSAVDLKDVDENLFMTLSLAKGKRYAVLVDARHPTTISKEAMEYASRPECYKDLIAQAIVTDSLANRLVGNFIIKFHKPTSPTRLFSKMEDAEAWLRECIANDGNLSEPGKKRSLKMFM
jgi:hypothetical protein